MAKANTTATWTLANGSIAKDGGQKVRLEYLFAVKAADGAVTKVRLVVVSDAYRNQCEAKAERFDGQKWQPLCRLATGEMETPEGLVYRDNFRAEQHYDRDLDVLTARVNAILF